MFKPVYNEQFFGLNFHFVSSSPHFLSFFLFLLSLSGFLSPPRLFVPSLSSKPSNLPCSIAWQTHALCLHSQRGCFLCRCTTERAQ